MARFTTIDLLRHYEVQKEKYPWKREDTPPDIQVLVEGALEDGMTGVVQQRWGGLFEGIKSAQEWLDRPATERSLRVKGLCRVESVDWLAEELLESRRQDSISPGLQKRAETWFPAAMAILRFGSVAIPVNNVIRRVAGRIGDPPDELVTGLVHRTFDARFASTDGRVPKILPPMYKVMSAFLDIADSNCRIWVMRCLCCALREGCDHGSSLKS